MLGNKNYNSNVTMTSKTLLSSSTPSTLNKTNTSMSNITPEAREWTSGLEKFKSSINTIYSICQRNKTISGCKVS